MSILKWELFVCLCMWLWGYRGSQFIWSVPLFCLIHHRTSLPIICFVMRSLRIYKWLEIIGAFFALHSLIYRRNFIKRENLSTHFCFSCRRFIGSDMKISRMFFNCKNLIDFFNEIYQKRGLFTHTKKWSQFLLISL